MRLKANGIDRRAIQYWVIPPEKNGEFVAAMEDVLELYAEDYDPEYPVLCMDEQPIQLHKEKRQPIPANEHHPERVDYEYERAGTASLFMFSEPLTGWREVRVREQRTKVDWAREVGKILRERYGKAEKVRLVCDNLNTHTAGAFYEAFEPKEARELVKRIEFHYTPKHGSWLNIAENELSAMTRQCVGGRRIGDIETFAAETAAWSEACNRLQRGVDWQFKTENARGKLKYLYPKIIV